MTLAGLPTLIAVTIPLRDHIALSTELLLALTLVLAIAAIGGTIVGAVAAVVASLLVNWYFVPPFNTLTIAEVENVVALGVFIAVAVTVGSLVVTASQQAVEANERDLKPRRWHEQPPASLPTPIRCPAFSTRFAPPSVYSGCASPPAPTMTRSPPAMCRGRRRSRCLSTPHRPTPAIRHSKSSAGNSRPTIGELFEVLADQLAVAVDKRRLAEETAEADKLADVDAVRTALLRAVSHDLRTPLASIKAMISGLRDDDVLWRTEQLAEAYATIEEETDRLNRLVGNLLDASRLQTGAVPIDIQPTLLGAIISSAVQGVDAPSEMIVINPVCEELTVLADSTLLERSLDNVIRNAVRHGMGHPVTIDAGIVNDHVHIRVIDRGPGVAMEDRPKVMRPFQRLDDHHQSDGVGLGLSIAQGFITAMHGTFTLDDTPGGGLTVTITLPFTRATTQ